MVWVKHLSVENLRCLARLELDLAPGINLVYGDNGAGKTSLVESLSMASRGCGPKPKLRDLCGPQKEGWMIRAGIQPGSDSLTRKHGLEYSKGLVTQEINNNPARNADLAMSLPLAALVPEQHGIMNAGPAARLRWLDWGMFHVEHSFLSVWRSYKRILRQRNAALKAGAPEEQIASWSRQAAVSGERLTSLRRDFLGSTRSLIEEELNFLVHSGAWEIIYNPGWSNPENLSELLLQSLETDRKAGITRRGPHRADLVFKLGDTQLQHHVSRGEEKLSGIALMLGMARYIARHIGSPPVVVIDDFQAELSSPAQQRVMGRLVALGGQVVLTGHEQIKDDFQAPGSAMFHVEHGVLGAG